MGVVENPKTSATDEQRVGAWVGKRCGLKTAVPAQSALLGAWFRAGQGKTLALLVAMDEDQPRAIQEDL